jgi:hypothetical protein
VTRKWMRVTSQDQALNVLFVRIAVICHKFDSYNPLWLVRFVGRNQPGYPG